VSKLTESWDLVPNDIIATLRLYCDTLPRRVAQGHGLVIGGGIGAGKTCCLALIEQTARREGIGVCYVRATTLFDEFYRGKYEFFDRAAPLLLIDDLGTEYRAELPMSRFVDMINDRWHHQRSTVITTNLSRKELRADTTLERVVSRLENRSPWLWTKRGDQRQPVSVASWAQERQETPAQQNAEWEKLMSSE
jgi:DNA replication protein DnaC